MLDTGPWRLVRHTPQGDAWGPAKDFLDGSAVYGDAMVANPEWSDKGFSLRFDNIEFDQFLFATGACAKDGVKTKGCKYLIANKEEVHAWYAGSSQQ